MEEKTFKVIDCDVHNRLNSDLELVPYLKEPWKSRVAAHGIQNAMMYNHPMGNWRKDSIPPNGGKAGSDPDHLIKQLIEEYNMEYAILNNEDMITISANHDPDYAAALVSAYNDYMIKEWYPKSKKLKGSICIATQDPQQAAYEIDRLGQHPDIVQVVMGSGARFPIGQRYYHPIFEAAERNNLPVGMHPGGDGSGINTAPSGAGYHTTYFQWHTCMSQVFMAHLVSLICDGVFDKYPKLKFVCIEGGISWLPHLMWRMDKNYKALRMQSPWLKKLPSEYIRDHCLFTTQPIEEPKDFKHLLSIFEMIDAENILMFASDYPHWDFDSPTAILKKLSREAKQKIFFENASKLYNLT